IARASRRSKISMISPVSASTYSNAICPFLYLNSSNDRCLGKDWYCLWCFFDSVVMTRCTVEVVTKQSLEISVKDCASVDFTMIFAFLLYGIKQCFLKYYVDSITVPLHDLHYERCFIIILTFI